MGRLRLRAPLRAFSRIAAALALLLIFSQVAHAANPAPVQIFYVPIDEDDTLASLQATNSSTSQPPVQSYISVAIGTDNTIVYYDQWEDGYGNDLANYNIYSNVDPLNPSGTQIWGNGNCADGFPPNVSGTTYTQGACEANPGVVDDLDGGDVVVLNSTVSDLTVNARKVIDFDGGDKIGATEQVAVSRIYWAAGTNTLTRALSKCTPSPTGAHPIRRR